MTTLKRKPYNQYYYLLIMAGEDPFIQLPSIDLDMYGIPSKCDFYKEDYQRLFLKLPLNQKNPEAKELTEEFLRSLATN